MELAAEIQHFAHTVTLAATLAPFIAIGGLIVRLAFR